MVTLPPFRRQRGVGKGAVLTFLARRLIAERRTDTYYDFIPFAQSVLVEETRRRILGAAVALGKPPPWPDAQPPSHR